VIAEILPACLASAEALDDLPDARLSPKKKHSVARSVDKRQREFTTARHCARRAFAQLGLPPTPVFPGPKGEPQWPSGIVGSITHCAGYRAAAIAQASDVVTIGIGAEPHGPLPAGAAAVVSSAPERAWLKEYAGRSPEVYWDRLLFSAKESVYKA
jgi:4'-phosphopantetheinyl transferase EntD